MEGETMSSTTYYDILGCTKDSTSEDIKRAYRSLVLKLHPDKNASELDGVKFQHVLEAWKVLCNPKLREEYDAIQKQDELDSESILVYGDIPVHELETAEDGEDTLVYPCRCGGMYRIERENVEKTNQVIYVPCLECTFHIVVRT